MLRTRLLVGLLPLVLVVAVVGIFSIAASRELAGSLQSELAAGYGHLLASERMRTAAASMTAALGSVRADPVGGEGRIGSARSAFERDLHAESIASAGGPRARLVADVDAAFQALAAHPRGTGASPGPLAELAADEAALFRVQAALDRLSRWDFDETRRTQEKAGRLAAVTFRVQAAGIAVALALAVCIAWRTAASLLVPIRALTERAEDLGNGDLDADLPEFSRDELGRLARTFNALAVRLRAYRGAMTERVSRARGALGAALASGPDPVFVVNQGGVIEACNAASSEMRRLPEFSDGFPPSVAGHLARVLATGEHHLPDGFGTVVTVRVGPEPRHYLPRIVAIGDALTEFKGAAVILQDVTRFRLLDDAKSNLVGTVSHELKTPLTSLRMAIYLLLEESLGPLEAPQREMLASARDDADRLLRLLDGLLDLSRLEAGVAGLHRMRVAPAGLASTAAAEARGLAAAAGLGVALEVEPGLDDVAADPVRLQIVFSNLISNAVKHAARGSAIVLGARRGEGSFVLFHVRNPGSGVPADALPRIFERFYRAPGQTVPGAGLGLAIAREIVVAHGGTIDCVSRPDEWAEFRFRLPVWGAESVQRAVAEGVPAGEPAI